MLAAFLFIALQSPPPDLKLSFEKFKSIPDRLAVRLGFPSFCPQRGYMVSDDGAYVAIRSEKGDANIMLEEGNVDELTIFEQPGDSGLPIVSNSQKYVVQDKPDFKEKRFAPAEIQDVLAARGEGYATVLHSTADDGKGAQVRWGISTVHYANLPLEKNRSIAWFEVGQIANAMAADISSDSFLLSLSSRTEAGQYKDLGTVLVGEKRGGPYKVIPGITPFLLDSAKNLVICFLYSEQGTPFGYSYRTLENEKSTTIQSPERAGLPQCAALLPAGRMVASFATRGEDETMRPGLYQTSGDFKKWEFLGPYALEGSSANGKVLMVSHLDRRRSYLLWIK